MASPKLYAEVWTRPGHATFGKVIADLPVISCSGTAVVNGIGEGRITVPKNYARLDEILKPDITTPANAVSSLIRVFSERSTTPIFEFIPIQFTGEQDKADPDIEISGPAIDSIWGHARLEAWDWTGADAEHSLWPDWIYGGRNILGDLESVYNSAVTSLFREATVTAGTFTIGISFNSGAISNTSAIAWNATGAAIDTELTAELVSMGFATASIEVSGSGSALDPWRIETFVPEGTYVFSVNSGGLTGGLVLQNRETIGAVIPAGWTTSFNPVNNIQHGVVTEFRASTYVSPDPSAPACDTTGVAIMFNGLAGGFPGIQKIVPVKPGGRYFASATAYAQGTTGTYRFVIRDLFENPIAAEPDFNSGTTISANTWTVFDDMVAVVIPDDVDRVIVRFAAVGSGNPPPTFVTCLELREGMPPDTWGEYLTQLFLDATSDHAPGRVVWEDGTSNLPYLSLDFTPTVDTNGNAYTDPEVSITLKRGQNYLRVLSEAYKMGYEGRIVPDDVANGTWQLQFYNTLGMMVDYTLVSNGPSIQGGRDVTRRDLRRYMPSSTDVAVEGGGQNIARAQNAGAITALGRIEAYQPNQDLGSMIEAATVADQSIVQSLSRSQSLTYILTPAYTDPQPFIDYRAGDMLYVLDPPDVPVREARRIKSLQFTFTKQTVQYTIQLESASFAGVGPALAAATDFLMKEFKAIREQPEEPTDILNYFPLSGSGTPTIVIAASNATDLSKDKADFICTGIADNGIFNIALTLLGLIPGRIVLTEGDYYFTGEILVTNTVRFEGMGMGATRLILEANSDFSMFRTIDSLIAPYSVEFANLSMNGQKALQSDVVAGISCPPNSENNIKIENCHLYDFEGYGVYWQRAAGQFVCTGSHISGNTLTGLHLEFEGFYKVTDCDIYSNGDWGIEADGAANLILSNNRISNNVSGGFSAGGAFQAPGVVITGNKVSDNNGPGIRLDGGGDTISGNLCMSNDGAGIECYAVNESSVVTGNLCYGNGGEGILLHGAVGGVCSGNTVFENGFHGISINGKWTVTGNRIEDNGRTTNNTYDGISVSTNADDTVVTVNVVRQDGAANKQRYGINVLAGATTVWVAGNDARGTYGTGNYNDAGTGTINVWAGTFGDNY